MEVVLQGPIALMRVAHIYSASAKNWCIHPEIANRLNVWAWSADCVWHYDRDQVRQ